jgi:hypothetical protein
MGESLCMGLSSAFVLTPTPRLDAPRWPARPVHMDVLDRDLLLAFAPVPVQGLQQGDVGARELVGLGEALPVVPRRSGPGSWRGGSTPWRRCEPR